MRTVNIREARKQLSELVDAAERGQSVMITRHGKQVARIDPAEDAAGGPLPDLGEFRKSIQRKGPPLSKVVARSRREARY